MEDISSPNLPPKLGQIPINSPTLESSDESHHLVDRKERRPKFEKARRQTRHCINCQGHSRHASVEYRETCRRCRTYREATARREVMRHRNEPCSTVVPPLQSTNLRPQTVLVKTIAIDLGAHEGCGMELESSKKAREVKMTTTNMTQGQGTLIGPTMELEPLLLDLASGQTTPSGGTYRNLGGTPFLFDEEANAAGRTADIKRINQIEKVVGADVGNLIEIYQKTIHPSLPVVGAELLANHTTARENWNAALLAAVCSISQTWLPGTPTNPRPSSSSSAIEELAFSLLSDSMSRPTLPTIQAGLILMQRPNVDTKRLNTQLVDAAYELGLQLDCSSWSISDGEKRLRKRLAWALYMQDKWCSLVHGRPSYIASANWIVKPLGDSDFDETSDPTQQLGQDIFMRMASLTEILAMVLDTFYTPKAMDEVQGASQGGTRLILERAKPAQLRMRDWFSGLPSRLKLDAQNEAPNPSGVGYLHLAYFSTEITLHRCIIRSLSTGASPDAYLAHICRSAAKTRLISSMDFVNRLRPAHLGSFWYFPSRTAFALIGTFGALLRATAPGQEEADFYASRLVEYRWTISVSARRAPFLQFALKSLDDAEALLTNLPAKPTTKEIADQSAREESERKHSNGVREESDLEEADDDEDEDVDMADGYISGGSDESDESEQ